MHDQLNQGLAQGVVIVIGALLIWLAVKLYKAKSEGARRAKMALTAVAAILLVAVLGGGRPMDTIIVIAALAGAVWIYRGFKKKA